MVPWSLETFWERIAPTFIENWPQALRERSLPALDLQVPWDELLAAMSHSKYRGWFPNLQPHLSLDALEERIDAGLAQIGGPAFLRLGSRSPKDGLQAQQFGLRIEHGHQGVRLLTSDSRRAAFDIRCAMDYSTMPRLFLRPWRTIPTWSEFRCFIQGGEVVGISQYDFRDLGRSEIIVQHAERIEAVLREALAAMLPEFHLPDIIADLILVPNEDDRKEITKDAVTNNRFDAMLLELNPFIVQTNPALFTWLEPFDRRFRFIH
ncbi:hypothetical protein [Acanthopleuribacter pedis]|uniref:Uncharacterized protein n=1 Tax=Acanthopleuribacter pedis TaxID=442870 RepID=A0A8J7Q3J4_9BACT|nr:hypothetical protein [Acanthopleuribacter pedis]MBO1317308.1 hypothetical protein [Acanthopleuribacter pedis]MBO1318615.1 hypothetical protein [Acanthopleuribacter pedis]